MRRSSACLPFHRGAERHRRTERTAPVGFGDPDPAQDYCSPILRPWAMRLSYVSVSSPVYAAQPAPRCTVVPMTALIRPDVRYDA